MLQRIYICLLGDMVILIIPYSDKDREHNNFFYSQFQSGAGTRHLHTIILQIQQQRRPHSMRMAVQCRQALCHCSATADVEFSTLH